MSEIKRILAAGKSMRALAAVPSIDALRRVSENLGFELPASYIEFCQLGGLGELRLNNRVLSPDEILTSRDYAPANLVPFAGNGCGDLYCWAMAVTQSRPLSSTIMRPSGSPKSHRLSPTGLRRTGSDGNRACRHHLTRTRTGTAGTVQIGSSLFPARRNKVAPTPRNRSPDRSVSMTRR